MPPRPTFSLLAVSDRRTLAQGFPDWLRALAGSGVDALQLREKDLGDRELFELARTARALFPPPGLLLVNGRADIALAAGADGVHLPADGVPLAPLRTRFGPAFLVGRSTHTLEEVAESARDGADYVTFGPVYPTPGKGPAAGCAALAEAAKEAAKIGVPVLALGGVKIERFSEIAAAGASGVAAIRSFQEPPARLASLVRSARRCFA